MGSRSMGFTAVINPENTDMNQAAPLLAILTRFIAIMLRNRDMLNNLDQILTEVDKRMYEDKKNSRERRLPETSGMEHPEK